MLITKLRMTDLKAYRALRLHVIESSPSAFTSSVAEENEARDDRFLADIAPRAGKDRTPRLQRYSKPSNGRLQAGSVHSLSCQALISG
jgi:hypothetical protein